MQKIDLTGKQFGFWTVLGPAERRYSQTMWSCRCVCGSMKDINGQTLRSNLTKSCGCMRGDQIRKAKMKYGGASTEAYLRTPIGRAYSIWRGMIQRCSLPWSHNWKYYGARGITVCRRWMDFNAFVEDMGVPGEGDSIDRIDNDGNYEPSNCRWADRVMQRMNQRPRGTGS